MLSCAAVRIVALKHFLPIGLVCAIVVGLAAPQLGLAVGSVRVGMRGVFETAFVCLIFFISGLTLKTDDVKSAVRMWRATLFGVTSILFLTPLIALAPLHLLALPHEFRVGFLLFCCMPTTINSGVALVQAAGGNFALALMLTVVSNLLGVATAPFLLSLLLSVSGITIDALPLLGSLVLTLLLPLLIGKACRELFASRVLPLLKRRKQLISNVANACLITIPWMKLSASRASLLALSRGAIGGLLFCGLALHGLYLLFNYACATWLLRCPLDVRKSVVIMASQKTLPMAMTVLAFFPSSLGEAGLIAIPCILSHLCQIFADAFLAAAWARVSEAEPGSGHSSSSCCSSCCSRRSSSVIHGSGDVDVATERDNVPLAPTSRRTDVMAGTSEGTFVDRPRVGQGSWEQG